VVRNTADLLCEFWIGVEKGKIERMSSAHSAETVLLSLAPALGNDSALLKKMLRRLSEITQRQIWLVSPTRLAWAVPAAASKYRLAAATNRKGSAHMVLEHLGVDGFFEAVATSKDAPPKPHPGMLLALLDRMGLKPAEAIFIGDNKEDEEAGEKAGIRTVLVEGRKRGECERILVELGL
jgi:HAD superfamily hydrolase (TIGR01549 family)